MTRDVALKSSSAVAALGSLKAGLQNVQTTIRGSASDPFLRLLRSGEWVYGAENIEIEDGSVWAINPLSIQHGWVAWTDRPGKAQNEVVGEIMVPMTSPLPAFNDLPEPGDATASWVQQLQFQLRCTNGEDVGEQVLYKTTSTGGLNAVRTLIGQIMAQLDVDADRPVPLVQLATDSYEHKKWGKTFTPVLEVVGWADMEGVEGEPEEAAAPEAPEPQKARQRAAAATGTPSAADRKAALQQALADEEAEADEEEAAPAAAAEPVRRRRRG